MKGRADNKMNNTSVVISPRRGYGDGFGEEGKPFTRENGISHYISCIEWKEKPKTNGEYVAIRVKYPFYSNLNSKVNLVFFDEEKMELLLVTAEITKVISSEIDYSELQIHIEDIKSALDFLNSQDPLDDYYVFPDLVNFYEYYVSSTENGKIAIEYMSGEGLHEIVRYLYKEENGKVHFLAYIDDYGWDCEWAHFGDKILREEEWDFRYDHEIWRG